MRKQAREVVYKALYSLMFNPDQEGLLQDLIIEEKLNAQDGEFAQKLFNAVCANSEDLEQSISELANNYKLDRIYPTDRCALLIGMCEMKFFDDVPNIVAIDEALALCRVYSTATSLSFVNGIFAEYKNRIEKKGE